MKKYIDYTLVKILAVLYGFIVFISFIKKMLIIIRKDVDFSKIDWLNFLFGRTFLDWLLITLYMVFASAITKRMFSANLKFKHILGVHLFLAFSITWFIFFMAAIIQLLIGNVDMTFVKENILTWEHYIDFFDVNLVVYLFMASIIYIYFYIQKMNEIEIQKTSLKSQLIDTKMKILKSQLQPHFLFNTLNSISTLIETNPKQAQNTLVDLSELLRDILDLEEKDLIPLMLELSLLKKYLNIMEVRFNDHLTLKIDVSESVTNALLPSMILQPIVENSIKHGYSNKIKKLEIEIEMRKIHTNLVIKISNTGVYMIKSQFIKGNGVKNIISRLDTLFGDKYKFMFTNKKNKQGVITTIIIPFRTS
ncbi:sensor histidine kinase [Yeosuana marina]|uniref:sensor histidine kinase n=1 Tax=Yeosuana marina TaxID=1565536 RepID=UPI0030EBCCF4|tara:strand:- start:848 stop:1939 length:1092 start_codon:yes stop_codon:yes gene_type:complete